MHPSHLLGKKGIGLGKRARSRSPTSKERIAKMAKMAESTSQETFRDRTREDYHLKKTERQLVPALRTLVSLDKDAEKEVCHFIHTSLDLIVL